MLFSTDEAALPAELPKELAGPYLDMTAGAF